MAGVLPVDGLLPEIVHTLREGSGLVLEAPPGAGKTTRVPPALLRSCRGEIVVLEPRRLAARMAARRVAQELGEGVGETVGYQVRFEDVSGPSTRLRFVTEGVLNRRLLTDPELRGVGVVVLDEFHERHIDGDLALALLRRLQTTVRPDLRLLVMSATLQAAPIAEYLGACPVLRSQGRVFETAIEYTPHSAEPLEQRVAAALERLLAGGLDGDVLAFLPGAAEIRRSARACEGIARRAGLLITPLHGDLSPEEQDRAVLPADRPKLILSTNVAESSITIEGVTTVIDTGLARVAKDSHWTGLPVLAVERISQASANQRAGRAGRTRPGRVVRLYPEEDFRRRPVQDTPEIRRRELSQVVLELEALGIQELHWLEPPPSEALSASRALLGRLGARQHRREMARYPVHPRLARLLVEGVRRGVGDEACRAAAVLSSGDRFESSDLLEVLERELPFRTEHIRKQLARLVRARRGHAGDPELLKSLLVAFPDRVARRRSEREAQLGSGLAAALPGRSAGEFLIALDLEDRPDQTLPLIRMAAPIRPDWLLELFPERVTARSELVWNREAERVDAVERLLYDELPIEESRAPGTPGAETSALLAARALDAGLHRFVDPEELSAFLQRVSFASEHSAVPALGEADVKECLRELSTGLRSFAELRSAAHEGGLIRALKERLGPAAAGLDEVAPERLRLGRRTVKVNYAAGQQPWIESRLQDFFGSRETPRIARGAVPVAVHLLAPNHRPVQVTTDLAGFWTRLYPQVRRELMRRYPKHAWPEDPSGG